MFEPAHTPEWLREIKAEDALAESRRLQKDQRQATVALTIKQEGPIFWQNFRKEISLAAAALPEVGLRGAACIISETKAEVWLRFGARRPTFVSENSYVDINYRFGESVIRCHPQEGNTIRLQFCIGESGDVGVLPEDGIDFAPMNAERAVQFVLQPIVKRVRG